MDQSFIDQIKDFNIHLVVSIDTIDREFWKFVRGSDSFDLVFRNLDYAIRTLQPSQLSIQSVLAEETKGHVIQVGEFANSHNIYHSIQNYIQEGFEGHWTPIVTPTENNSPEDESSCYAAGRNISIMPNGDVYTCFQQSWIQGCEKPIGNLNANALDGMLSSQYTADVLSRMELCNKSCKVLKCNQK